MLPDVPENSSMRNRKGIETTANRPTSASFAIEVFFLRKKRKNKQTGYVLNIALIVCII